MKLYSLLALRLLYKCSISLLIVFTIFSSTEMVRSPYEWKILEWDEKPQTTKQKIILIAFTLGRYTKLEFSQ